jgi:dTDP-glucose 4,6-dehydratase
VEGNGQLHHHSVVVTGGAGFLGSHLCEELLRRGHRVLAVDNFVTGRAENVSHLLGKSEFSLLEEDVSGPLHVGGQVQLVVHLASPASPMDFHRLPFEILRVNSAGTWNVLELALAKGARFLLASTSEVYGDPLEHPQREEYRGNVNPIGPRAVYDEGKRFSEALTMTYHRFRGLNAGIARIFNTYGPRMRADDGRVIPTLIRQALAGEPLTVFGDGRQTRSFCYVDDMVRGLVAMAESKETGPVNLGNADEVTILEAARMIIEITGSASDIAHRPLSTDDPKRRRPDISRARELLGWEPKVPLREGLASTIDYFRDMAAQAG